MRWRGRRKSTNVEDRRGRPARAGTGLKLGGGAILLVAVVTLLAGGDLARSSQVAE